MRHLRAAGALSALGLLAACGPGNVVAMDQATPAATPVVTATAAPTPEATASDAVQACIHRFDYIPPVLSGDAAWQRWRHRHADDMESAIAAAATKHFDAVEVASVDGVRKGFVALGADPVRNRVIVLVDPTLVKMAALQRELGAAAEREHRANPKVAVLPAVVLPSCFGGPALADAREGVEKEIFHNPAVHNPSTSGVYLDSRQPVGLGTADHAVGDQLEREYGPMIEITYSDDRGVPT